VPEFQPRAYFRDRLVPATEAKLSIYDLGIVMGATVTDMARTYRHEPFRLKDHLVRFYESCKYARLQVPLSFGETERVTVELTRHNTQELAARRSSTSSLPVRILFMQVWPQLRCTWSPLSASILSRCHFQTGHTFFARAHMWSLLPYATYRRNVSTPRSSAGAACIGGWRTRKLTLWIPRP
jgi:branched-subunit amino acid aminotransferase/4-amino-4-deoxychorismate lyase